MTAENAKRLYEHYKKTGQVDKAEAILEARPEIKEIKETKKVK